jgi:hypothetical protein
VFYINRHGIYNPSKDVFYKDYSGGAYFFNASFPKTGYNWDKYNEGSFKITKSVGGTTFLRYSEINIT